MLGRWDVDQRHMRELNDAVQSVGECPLVRAAAREHDGLQLVTRRMPPKALYRISL